MADETKSLEGKFQDQVDRAVKAAAIKRDPLFIEAAEACKDDLWNRFLTCDPKDDKGLLIVRLEAEGFNKFMLKFTRHMDTGKLAAHELKRLKDAKQQKKPRDTRFVRHRAT